MLVALTTVGLFATFAWVTQYSMNRVIQADRHYLKANQSKLYMLLYPSSAGERYDDKTSNLY